MRDLVRTWRPVVLVLVALTLAACNAMRGLGEDISAAGRALTGAAAERAARSSHYSDATPYRVPPPYYQYYGY